MSGAVGYLAGASAEDQVAAEYERCGHRVAAQRWRGPGGEIDLILRFDDTLVFVEVKKSRDFARAAQRVSRRQIDRIMASASAYLAEEPGGMDTEVRFDVALVDASGRIRRIENAFMA